MVIDGHAHVDSNCMDKMESFYSEKGFRMLKLHQCWTPFDVSSPENKAITLWAGKRGVPIFIHLFSEQQAVNFVKTANEFKDTTFIVGHMIGYKLISGRLENKNVYFDLSAPQIYSESTLKNALNKIGPDRLILGSDSPYGLDNIDKIKKRLIKLSLTEDQTQCIYGKNLLRILHMV